MLFTYTRAAAAAAAGKEGRKERRKEGRKEEPGFSCCTSPEFRVVVAEQDDPQRFSPTSKPCLQIRSAQLQMSFHSSVDRNSHSTLPPASRASEPFSEDIGR
jgi:hypothetical protein